MTRMRFQNYLQKLQRIFLTPAHFILDGVLNSEGLIEGQIALNYGSFINSIITFVIVAFSVFLVVKAYNKMKSKQEASAPAEPSNQEKLLGEIRDLLKNK